MLRRSPLLLATSALFALTISNPVWAQDDVRSRKESALPPGVLPAWQMDSEVTAPRPRLRNLPPTPLPLQPPPGFRVPAEFEPVAAFVVSQGDWTDSYWASDIDMLIEMIQRGTVAGGAGAIVLTEDSTSSFESFLSGKGVDLSRVRVVHAPGGLNAKWARDFGPLSMYEPAGSLAFVDLHYYDKRPNDDAIAAMLAAEIGINRYGLEGEDYTPPDDAKLYLEGGNFQTDGRGTCILSNDVASDNGAENNPDADTLAEAEELLQQYLGCEQVIWLTPPPHTGTGHVDMYAKLLTPTDILVIQTPHSSSNDEEADTVLESNVAILEAATNLDGDPFQIHRITIPSIGWMWTYETYTNSTILNDIVLVPTYDSGTYDSAALQVYESVLGPGYTVVGVDASSIVAQGGAVHCTTMQIASACGDGTLQPLLFEACDGQDLGGATCESLGLPDGTLACTAACALDTSGCSGQSGSEPLPEAGTDVVVDDAQDEAPDADPTETGADSDVEADAARDAGADGESDAETDAPWDAAPQDGAIPSADETSDGGGCSCRQNPDRSTPLSWVLALGALGWAIRRRRAGVNRTPRATT